MSKDSFMNDSIFVECQIPLDTDITGQYVKFLCVIAQELRQRTKVLTHKNQSDKKNATD